MKNVADRVWVSAEGFSVQIQNCGHCGATPTDAEIEKALQGMDRCRFECAICREKMKWVNAKIGHIPRNGPEHDWSAWGDLEPYFHVLTNTSCPTSETPQRINLKVHVSCLEKKIPNLKQYDQSE